MRMYSSIFLCILFVRHGSGVLFMCSFGEDLLNIGLECKGGTKISIVEAWGFESDHRYNCTNEYTAGIPEFERRYGLRNSLWHKILTNCVGETYCKFIFYPIPEESHGIGIIYDCLPDDKFIRFCNQHITSVSYPNDVNLIFKNAGDTVNNTCRCDVKANGKVHMSLTQFPTNSGYLIRKSGIIETDYKNKLFINDIDDFHLSKNNNWQTFDVTYDPDEDVPFILILLTVESILGELSVKCFGRQTKESIGNEGVPFFLGLEEPEQESESVLGYVVTAIGTAVAILFTVACVAVVYHRNVKKRKGTKRNKKITFPRPTRKLNRNMHTSVSLNYADSLSHSYAEIGSISDYRHYVMPDDTSQQSFKMKISLGKLEGEEVVSLGCRATSNSKLHEDATNRPKQQTPNAQCMNNADEIETENSATVKDIACISSGNMSENMASVHLRNEKSNKSPCSVIAEAPAKDKLDENTDLPKDSEAEQKLDRENKTISREHYDPSGYLDLDITEKTSHQYLQKWIKEIYTVEQKARQAREEGKGEETRPVANRRVLILKNDQANKQSEYFYSNADDHKIAFSDEETLFP